MTNFTPRRCACISHEGCRRITESDERRSEINGIPRSLSARSEEERRRVIERSLIKQMKRVIALFLSRVARHGDIDGVPVSVISIFTYFFRYFRFIHSFPFDNFRSRTSDIPIERETIIQGPGDNGSLQY